VLLRGPYRLKVELAGLQTFEGSLTVQVQQDATVDVIMQVASGQRGDERGCGGRNADGQCQFAIARVVTRTPRALSSTVNGRSYQNLLVTVARRAMVVARPWHRGMVRGNRAQRIGHARRGWRGAERGWEGWDVARQPSLDAVEELPSKSTTPREILTSTSVVISTRSGTNQFHGVTFYTNRNSAYGVARRREDTFTKAPYVNRNEFGVSLGGPVIIPKVYNGHNRTFFFWNWEQTRFL
jgi:hypothetical protein